LVEHYRQQMTLNYLRVRYEDLAFHENRRYARTASYAQVTERLYDRSRCPYRYRHYLAQLQSVIPILQPVVERLGYEI
jgi:hypothetical protein